MDKIRWGILSTGNVANNFAHALSHIPDAELIAVASRREENASQFADKWSIARRYSRYDAFAHDPDIDIVYIASPHNYHYEHMLLCLNAGKHVLCEKAFTLNATQAEDCIKLAREKNLYLMEAMWMRFFPATAQLRDWLKQGIIGEMRLVQADFCLNIPFDAEHRLYNPKLAGGALLDLGIYPISFASMVMDLDTVQDVKSITHFGKTGVDELDSIIISYQTGTTAMLSCGLQAYKPREAFIIGTKGYIKVHNIFFRPDRLTLHLNRQEPDTIEMPFEGNGYAHEIHEVHRCLRGNLQESPLMPLDETLTIMRFMDALRQDWGLTYPEEQP